MFVEEQCHEHGVAFLQIRRSGVPLNGREKANRADVARGRAGIADLRLHADAGDVAKGNYERAFGPAHPPTGECNGERAKKRVEREVKKTRTRIERELRQRRTAVTRAVKRNRREFERSAKSLQSDAQGLAQRVQDQVTNLV